MLTMKVVTIHPLDKHERHVEVEVKKIFVVEGLRLAITRHLDYQNAYSVMEFSTGNRVHGFSKTLKDARYRAEQRVREMVSRGWKMPTTIPVINSWVISNEVK